MAASRRDAAMPASLHGPVTVSPCATGGEVAARRIRRVVRAGASSRLSAARSRQPTNRRPVAAGLGAMHGPQFVVDHRFTRRQLSAYIDGELESSERQRVNRHIVECRDCRFMMRSLRQVLGGLAGLRRCAPAQLSADVRARLGSRSPSRAGMRKRPPFG